jgi:hypothetical protein
LVIRPDRRLWTLAKSIGDLVAAIVGDRFNPLDIRMKLHPLELNRPIEDARSSVARDAETNFSLKHSTTTFEHLPSFNIVTPQVLDFHLDTSSQLGTELSDNHFTPVVVVSTRHASAAWTVLD